MKTKFYGILALFLVVVVQFTFAQDKTISGTVSDPSGFPLAGVNIIVKGTTNGTQTDFDGHYIIIADVGEVLIFSHLGLKTVEQTIGNEHTINVTMVEDTTILDEIVVTGVAGPTSRKKLTVTVNKVGSEVLELVPAASAESALQGKVAGIKVTNFGQPGAGATIILRGAKNLFGSQEPLIILDGIIIEGGLSDVNVNDVESYEIVKGAAASALYGSRAGNGVIVITTKRGKGKKTEVTLRNDIGFNDISNKIKINRSHHYNLASDWESVRGIYTKYDGVTYPSDYTGGGIAAITGVRLPSADGYSDNPYGAYYDPQDQFFKTGINKTLYASVSTSTNNFNTYFSAESTTFEGVLVETDGFERNNFRINADFQINDWLKFSTSNLFIKTNDNSPGGIEDVFFILLLTEADVDLAQENTDGQPYLYTPNLWDVLPNPLYSLYKNQRDRQIQKFLGAYKLNFKFSDWINFDTEYSFENLNNRFTSNWPYDTWETGPTGLIYSEGSLTKTSSFGLAQKIQGTLNIRYDFNDALNVSGKFSYLLEDNHFENFEATGNNYLFQGLPTLDNFAPADISASSTIQDIRAHNFFGIISFDYKDRYLFDFMGRYDGSSLFGKNERWHPYYRVSGAYRLSKDLEIDGIQELKINAAYGTAGQRPGFDWQYETTDISNGLLSSNRVKGNPDLKPSKTSEFEVGLSTKFLERFIVEAVYSKAETEDQFMLVDIFPPANEGKNKQWQNVGSIKFNTYEVTLGINDVLNSDTVKWNLNFTFDTTKNEITKLDVPQRQVGPGDLFLIKEGEEFGSMYGRAFVRTLDQMETQLPIDMSINEYSVNSDGVVVETANIGTVDESPIILLDEDGVAAFNKIGNQTADFKIGAFSTLAYKNFSLSMLWDYSHGGDVYNLQNQWLTRDYRNAIVDQSRKAGSDKKSVNYYQGLMDGVQANAFWVEDATYLKLREASLYYSFHNDVLGSMANGFFSELKIGITGRNLLTFTDYTGWDPEVLKYDPETLQYYSFDHQIYPNSRTFTFTVQLKF